MSFTLLEQQHYLSVIVPVYNEEQNIPFLHEAINRVLRLNWHRRKSEAEAIQSQPELQWNPGPSVPIQPERVPNYVTG